MQSLDEARGYSNFMLLSAAFYSSDLVLVERSIFPMEVFFPPLDFLLGYSQ